MRSPVRPLPSVPFKVQWDRAPDEVAKVLSVAASGRHYVDPGRDERPFYRLQGSVMGSRVSIRATSYIIPGVPTGGFGDSMTLGRPVDVEGEIRAAVAGSELDGAISVPFTTGARWTVVIGAAIFFVLIVPSAGLLPWIAVEGISLAMVPWDQRRIIRRKSGELGRALVAIVEDPRPTA